MCYINLVHLWSFLDDKFIKTIYFCWYIGPARKHTFLVLPAPAVPVFYTLPQTLQHNLFKRLIIFLSTPLELNCMIKISIFILAVDEKKMWTSQQEKMFYKFKMRRSNGRFSSYLVKRQNWVLLSVWLKRNHD